MLAVSSSAVSMAATAAVTPKELHSQEKNIIVFVWDGMRPDAISKVYTPNLYALTQKGSVFSHNHSSFPTFTMMNASSFATGDFAGKTGFYGNTLWNPKAHGNDEKNNPVDFKQPVFTEDYHILQDLDNEGPLVQVQTLFNAANAAGMRTAVVGKSGPAFFQDYKQKGVVFDEKHVYPEKFAAYLKAHHYSLPADTKYAYKSFVMEPDNGNPTGYGKVSLMSDGVTTDPSVGIISPFNKDNAYLMDSYLKEVVPYARPQLSVVWLRNPDTTEHNYGVGSKAFYSALRSQDAQLGKLEAALKAVGKLSITDIIVVSDHGHSNVSGPQNTFPLRDISKGKISHIDADNGYSVSGDFRPAALLHHAGFNAYDGEGCEYDPTLTGITASGKHALTVHVDTTGKVCGGDIKVVDQNGHRDNDVGTKYTTASYKVPEVLPKNAVVVAANGGSTYLYVPSHNKSLVGKLVRTLQSHEQFGAVLVDQRYGSIPGTLPLSLVKLENTSHRNPDIIVSSSFDAKAVVQGFSGTEFNSDGNDRGMHGSFSPVDIHNMLIAVGPDFKRHFKDTLPSGNVDVAPTIAHLLGLKLPNADGRPLLEALNKSGVSTKDYQVINATYSPVSAATGITLKSADHTKVLGKKDYTFNLNTTQVKLTGSLNSYTYFNQASAVRY